MFLNYVCQCQNTEILKMLSFKGTLENPPNPKRIPSKIVHLHQYAIDMACVATPDMTERRKVFKKHVYDIMSYLDNARRNPPAIRIAPKTCRHSLRARMEKHPRSRGSRHCEIDMVCGNP